MRAWDPRVCERSAAFWPLRDAVAAFADCNAWPGVDDYAAAFQTPPPIRFEPARPRPRRGPRWQPDPKDRYDGRIHLARAVPTRRQNWHDFFNALVWATFPRAKWQLHGRQFYAARDTPGMRSREQDALTLLDEGGIVLLCRAAHEEGLRAALARRADEDVAELLRARAALALIFGHALYDHLANHGGPVRGMVAVVTQESLPLDPRACVEGADAGLAALLARGDSFQKPAGQGSLPLYLPLPPP